VKAYFRAAADPARKGRLVGIDAVRYIAMVAVVFIHTLPRQDFGFGLDAGGIVNQTSRFAVPFFFITSGFFLANRDLNDTPRLILSFVRRIAPVFIIWSLLYLALTGNVGRLAQPGFLAWTIATGGPGYHLWFLPALCFGLTAVAIVNHVTSWKPMFCVMALLYLMGLALGSYGAGVVAIPPVITLAIARILCGPMFVLIGFWLSKSGWRLSLRGALALFIAGAAFHVSEAYWLDFHRLNPFHRNDFLLGTLPLGLGAFLIAMNLPSHAGYARVLAALGTYSLGMYAIHVIFILVFRDILQPHYFSEKLLLAAIVVACSTVITLVLARIRTLRALLT
jgi:surface polysaccharide O-acyltransferase-like enzyme